MPHHHRFDVFSTKGWWRTHPIAPHQLLRAILAFNRQRCHENYNNKIY